MINIVIDKDIPYIYGALDDICNVNYLKADSINNKTVKDADALLIRTRTKINRELLKNSKLKFIGTATAGIDHIDIDYCKRAGIHWENAPGCNSSSVMQYIAAALSFLAKKHNFRFHDKVLGIVGAGHVGSKLARMAKILGLRVLLNDPPRERNEGPQAFVPIERILKESDIISFHVPLITKGVDKTTELCNSDFFEGTKRGAIIINSSRGEVVDEDQLIKNLKTGKLSGAVLDVWRNEPDCNPELLKLADLGTPHIAGYSADGKAMGTSIIVKALSSFFKLGLDNWESHMRDTTDRIIRFDNKLLPEQEILSQAILTTYPIMEDHHTLIRDISKFESLRTNYPVRREFPAYTIEHNNIDPEILLKLRELGFN